MKIFVCDFCMRGVGHVPFNSAFIKMLLNIYKEDVVYFAECEQAKNVLHAVSSHRASASSINIHCPVGWRVVFADLWNSVILLWVFFKNADMFEHVYILNRLPITMMVGNLANYIIKKKVFNVIHGEVEYLVNPNTTGHTKQYSMLFKVAYKLSTINSIYIILGESIYKCLCVNNISFGRGEVIIIDHPYDYSYKASVNKWEHKDVFNIGCIGSATRRKNSQYLFELRKYTHSKNVKYSIVGELYSDIEKEFDTNGIEYFSYKVPGDLYENKIRALDYSLCFYDNKINLALASGSFFDSIKYLKPILALRGNPFVDYYFEKLGNIGYRFSNVKEMAMFLDHLSSDEGTQYECQINALKKAQTILSLQNIMKDFKKQLINMKLL